MCVLIVEDEEPIRVILAEEFSGAGYEVREAENGDAAASLIESGMGEFTLLVTDVNMPGHHDGLSVARLMRDRHPKVPVIFITGRPDALGPDAVPTEAAALLAKPFVPSALMQLAHRLLSIRAVC